MDKECIFLKRLEGQGRLKTGSVRKKRKMNGSLRIFETFYVSFEIRYWQVCSQSAMNWLWFVMTIEIHPIISAFNFQFAFKRFFKDLDFKRP